MNSGISRTQLADFQTAQSQSRLGFSAWWGLLFVSIIGLALRLHSLQASEFRLDADEAIVGLMAKHIVEGRGIPCFYYGQHYMGSLESLLIAGGFWLFGASSALVKFVPLLFSVCLIPLMFALVNELAGRRAAWYAALLTALPPSALVAWGSMARGGFIEIIVIGALAFLSHAVFLKDTQKNLAYLLLAGLLCGLGWWVNNQIIYFMLPIGLFSLLSARQTSRPMRSIGLWTLVGVFGFLVGGAAYWLYNLRNDFASFKMLGGAQEGASMVKHLSGFVFESLPILLGARRFWQVDDLFPFAFVIGSVLYGSLTLVWLWSCRGEGIGLVKGRLNSRSRQLVLAAFIFTIVAVFAGSSFGHLSVAPRYVLPFYVGLFAIVAIGLDRVAAISNFGAVLMASILLSFNLLSTFWNGTYVPGEPVVINRNRVQKDHQEIIAVLQQLSIGWVKTDYWIGNRLAFETNEQVKPLAFGAHKDCRVPEYCERTKDEESNRLVPYLLVPDQVRAVLTGLTVQGIRYKTLQASGYTLVYDLSSQDESFSTIQISDARTSASHGSENARFAVDGDSETRWGTSANQDPDMYFRVDFAKPTQLSGIDYSLGSVPHDYPRKLRVVVTKEDGSETEVLSPSDYSAVRYLLTGDGKFRFTFEQHTVRAVTLYQVGHDSVFDWSLAELSFLGRKEALAASLSEH
jgi:hypothetical protein